MCVRVCVWVCACVCVCAYLLQLEGDHGEGGEDGVRGPCDGDDPLRTGALRDVDACTALWGRTPFETTLLTTGVNVTLKGPVTPACDVIRGGFPNRLVGANPTTPGVSAPWDL